MSKSVSLTGSDVTKINNRLLTDLADGDAVTLTFPNDISNIKTGKEGNAIFAKNETGNQAEVVIRVLRGSADDRYLNNELNALKNDFSGYVLLNAEFIKKVGDGQGNITHDTYLCTRGMPAKQVEAKTSSEGDTEQSVSVYTLRFAYCERTLG